MTPPDPSPRQTRPVGVLRPAPGNAATAARLVAAGLVPIALPLFRIVPVAWTPPDPRRYDALVLTSANAVRHAGPALAALRALPVHAVGAATARAARDAGFAIGTVGDGGVAALPPGGRLLHLAGREHHAVPGADTIVVYASEPLSPDLDVLAGAVALVHSARAGQRLAALATDRAAIAIAAISQAAAAAAGDGWRALAVADAPTDAAMIAAARLLAD